jgi:hypothetical protein
MRSLTTISSPILGVFAIAEASPDERGDEHGVARAAALAVSIEPEG